MHIARRDRIWLLGGLVVALLLTLVAWQFFIKGQHDKTDSINSNIVSTDQQRTTSQRQLNALTADNANLAKYKAQLAADRSALPTDAALPDFIRQVHAAADASHMAIVQLQIGAAAPVVPAPAGAPVYSVTVNMVASGQIDGATALINQLQAVQPRALLLSAVGETPGAGAGAVQVNLTFQAFIQPVDGQVPSTS